jgi:orotate phosphoribosyltransferase
MQEYKQKFIEFMVDSGVLTFGDFMTKSGRKTPFLLTRETTKPVHSWLSLANICRGYSKQFAITIQCSVWTCI